MDGMLAESMVDSMGAMKAVVMVDKKADLMDSRDGSWAGWRAVRVARSVAVLASRQVGLWELLMVALMGEKLVGTTVEKLVKWLVGELVDELAGHWAATKAASMVAG